MASLLKRKKIIFNIHLILSIICVIPLLLIAISGSFISYQTQISDLINYKIKSVESNGSKPLAMSEILAKFKEQSGVAQPIRVQIKNEKNASIRISASRGESYFVSPYTGDILGIDKGEKLSNFILSLHRNLTFSMFDKREFGKNLVAVNTIILIILIISGIWLYFPQLKNNFKKAIKIRLNLKGFSFFYNIHSVLGVYLSLILLVICLSGLYYSYEFVRQGVWALAGVKSESMQRRMHRQAKNIYKFEDVEKVYEIFKQNRPEFETATIILPDNNGKFRIFYNLIVGNERSSVDVSVDGTSFDNASNTSLQRRINGVVYGLHTGLFFGGFGVFVWCISSFMIVVFAISGFYMSSKRTFKNK